MALPTLSRRGGVLIGAHVNERDARFNLLETIFSANDEGMLSLAALDLVPRTDCVAIVRPISGLGRNLNIATTAEGAETVDQLDRRRAEGCNEVQGFLSSAEKPASEIAELLARFGARVAGRASRRV